MSTEKLIVGKCPVCEAKGFKNIDSLIKHIQKHNVGDSEYKNSVVVEQDKRIQELFG